MRATELLAKTGSVFTNGVKKVPVFYACDDKFVKIMLVSIKSLIANTTPGRRYEIHILHTDISRQNQEMVKRLATTNCKIIFDDVSAQFEKIKKKICLRDYYTPTTYYRLLIADMFPQFDKVVYIDADTVVVKDIYEMYQYRLGDCYAGVVHEQIVLNQNVFGEYVENVLGVTRGAYFNAGVMLINTKMFRKKFMLKQFVDMLNTYSFVVAQDQDYLNVLCKGHLLYLAPGWNIQMIGELPCLPENIGIIHYNLAVKPWHYKDCKLGEHFWHYAKQVETYETLVRDLENFSTEDKSKDDASGMHLLNLAIEEIANEHNYSRKFIPSDDRTLNRLEIRKKIEEFEKAGVFDKDVEDDPPAPVLLPDQIDYLKHSMTDKFRTMYAFRVARWFVNLLKKKKQLIIKEVIGAENLANLKSGAVVTCNHFNAFDSFAVQEAYDVSGSKRTLYRIIREGNYTGFPGFYGFLMRNCNTLPLSSNADTMKKFIEGVTKLLQKGNLVLIYPEQSMWWNYRKPKPLKKGGFSFAASAQVPVVPIFVTMSDSPDFMDEAGFPVQEYTIHISEPIYPDKTKMKAENVRLMMEENARVWKQIYEETYKIPLTYTCDEDKENEDE